jgi:hypothetical protein
LLKGYLDGDGPAPGRGRALSAEGSERSAWIAEYHEDGALQSVVVDEDSPITRDMVDEEEGNCLSCGLPFDSTTSHGHPVCRSKVTVTGDGGK